MDVPKLFSQASAIIPKVTDALLLKYPVATSIGVLWGSVTYFIVRAFHPIFEKPTVTQIIDISNLPWLAYCIAGMAVAITVQVRRRTVEPLPNSIEQSLRLISQGLKDGMLTNAHARIQYLQLIEQVVSQVELNQDMQEKIKRLNQEIEASPKALKIPSRSKDRKTK